MIIEKDWIVLTYIVLPQCCIYTCIRTTTYTSMQKSHLALTGYHLVCSVYDNIHIGVAQNTCARLMSVLPFTTSHGRCWVLGPFSSDFLFCCAFENRLQVEWFFFFFLWQPSPAHHFSWMRGHFHMIQWKCICCRIEGCRLQKQQLQGKLFCHHWWFMEFKSLLPSHLRRGLGETEPRAGCMKCTDCVC